MVLFEFGDQILHGGEVDAQAGGASLHCQGHGQMGFAHPGRSQKNDVALVRDKVQIKQRHDLALVQTGLEGEVKLVNGFDKGQGLRS